MGQHVELQEASEPTDIIWENRHFTPNQRMGKRWVVYVIIVILLSISGCVIFVCTNISLKLKLKYPNISCISVGKDYGIETDFKKEISAENLTRWTDDAFKEYDTN